MPRIEPVHEPHRIKTVRLLSFPTLEQRKRFLADAHFNVLRLTPQQLNFDMCSSGTSAFSAEQLSCQMLGDEAYAGSVSFEKLQHSVGTVLGHTYACPAHNALGCVKLIASTLLPPGSAVAGNARSRLEALAPRGIPLRDLRDRAEKVFTGNVDLAELERALVEKDVAAVDMQAFADGQHPFSMDNLRRVRAAAAFHGKPLICDGSRVIENAWYVQRHEEGYATRRIADIVKLIVKTSDLFQLDGGQDPKCHGGAVLTTDIPDLHESLMNDVVIYEGLHTYGGMSGRTMELLARGLAEMCEESEVQWVMHQTERFTERLLRARVPLERGCDGAYVKVDEVLPHVRDHVQDSFSAALYELSGVRAVAQGLVSSGRLVPVQIPRLAMTNEQLDQVADALVSLYRQREKVTGLQPGETGEWRDQMEYHGPLCGLTPYEFDTFPYEIHTVESIGMLSREERESAIRTAGYNTFLLRSADVTIDLLTDSGTSAMSTEQWSAYDAARECASASPELTRLTSRLEEITGYKHIIPTHQGRAAEQILSEILISRGQLVPGNMYFTTTKLHQELAGGRFVDVIVDEAHDPADEYPWKGNVSLDKLKRLVDDHGADRIAYLSFEHSVNMAGGQPASMDNMKEVYAFCSQAGVPVMVDATRSVENACMIQLRDERYRSVPIRDILREMMLYGDGCTISGKKDFLINIGGVLAFRENVDWARRAERLLRVYEGTVFSGGLAVADLAAMAEGVLEMLDDRYIRSRIRQTQALASMLVEAGVPIVRPAGSHAVFLDARRFLSHLDQDDLPAQRLAAELFVETGVRAMERGIVSAGRNPETGENYHPSLELVRLTIPRRVYTNDQMTAVANGIIRLYERREEIKGLRFAYEPERLRFFQARFEPL